MTPQEYFEAHSLDPTFIKEKFGIAWSDDTITIPVYGEDKKLLFCRYRHLTGDAKFSSDKGSHPALFGVHKIKNTEEVVLCEGEPDCMRLWQAGIPAVTGTSGVKTFSKSLVKPLTGKIVNILLDSDEAGKTSVEKYVEVLSGVAKELYIISLPAEYKDVSDYLTAGKEFSALPKMGFEEWEVTSRPPEWKIENGEELMMRDVPPEEWFIDRVLSADGITIIGGAESTGKSFYTLTMAYSLASGKPWLDKFPVKKQTNVLFIDKENSARRRKARIAGLGMTSKEALRRLHWISYPQYFQLADPKEEDGMSKFAKMVSKEVKRLDIGLIIVDSLTDIMVGSENSQEDTQALFDSLRILFPTQGILLLHHENKPSQGVSRNASQRMRGSTNITAQIVSGFRVFAIPKTENEFVLEQFKAGDSQRLKPFKVKLVVTANPYNAEKTIISDVKHDGDYYDEEGKAELGEELVLAFMEENPTASRTDLLDHLLSSGIGKRTGDKVIRDMTEAGQLEKVRAGKFVSYMLK